MLPELRAFGGRLNIISFNPEILRELHRHIPEMPVTLALWTEYQGRQQEAFHIARDVGADTISLADTMVLAEQDWIERAHRLGLKVHAYPVSPARGEPEFSNWTSSSQLPKWQRLAALQVDGILSDFPRETLNFFRRS